MLTFEKLAELLEQHRSAASARVKEFSIGGRKFNFNLEPAVTPRAPPMRCKNPN